MSNVKTEGQKKMACDDIFVFFILAAVGLDAAYRNWIESDWWVFAGASLLSFLSVLILSIRLYHVFGLNTTESE